MGKILRRSARLAEPPDTGHVLRGYEAIHLREVLVRPYRLIYRVQGGEQIDIITVLHYRQLLPGDLSALAGKRSSAKK